MRLLHQRHDHEGKGTARSKAAGDRGRGARGAGRASLPLRNAQSDRCRRHACGQVDGEDLTMNAPTLTRRGFTKALGGIVLAFSLDPADLLAQGAGQPAAARLPGSLNNNRLLHAWVRIGGDGDATVHTGKVELGQGILTALWQIAAEELDLPLSRVRI